MTESPPWLEEHVSRCSACRWKRHHSAIAMHEATHLAVATALGIEVEFCSIDDTKEVEVNSLEARLYPVIPVGTKVPAVITRLAEDSLEKAPRSTLVAMVAPSCLVTGDEGVDTYAALEAMIGTHMAKTMGHDPDEILDWAKREVEMNQEDIIRYAERLALEGRIDL